MYGIRPWEFLQLSTRTMYSLAEEIPARMMENHAHTAQSTYVLAKTMGGFDGKEDAFLLDFARPAAAAKPHFISAAVDASVRTALSAGLVSQDMLDLLTRHGLDV